MRLGDEPGADSGAWGMEDELPTIPQPVEDEPEGQAVDPDQFVMVRKAAAQLSAGGGLIPDEGYSEERYAFRRTWLRRMATSPKNVIVLQVDGDSMSPTLQNGNVVLVDTGRNRLKLGRIFAIGIGDVIAVKRLDMVRPGILEIHSDNSLYGKAEVPMDDIRIIGEIIWSARTWV